MVSAPQPSGQRDASVELDRMGNFQGPLRKTSAILNSHKQSMGRHRGLRGRVADLPVAPEKQALPMHGSPPRRLGDGPLLCSPVSHRGRQVFQGVSEGNGKTTAVQGW